MHFIGAYFEWTGSTSTMKKYYSAGGARVAVRTGSGTLNFILSDHPSLCSGHVSGSTSVTTDSNGAFPTDNRYKAWGESRFASGTLPTKFTYTGQYSNVADFGLMYYGARWYDSALSRFAQADSIIPQPGDPLAWDRFAAMLNNPVIFVDPTGHAAGTPTYNYDPDFMFSQKYGVKFTGTWTYQGMQGAIAGIKAVAGALAKATGGTPGQAFQDVYEGVELEFCDNCVSDGWGWAYDDHHIKFDGMYKNIEKAARFVTHELGHLFDRAVCAANSGSGSCGNIFAEAGTARSGLTGNMGTCGNSAACLGRKGYEGPQSGQYWGFAGGWEHWQYGQDNGTGEVWADMFVGWTFNSWDGDSRGAYRQGYMDTQMMEYLVLLGAR